MAEHKKGKSGTRKYGRNKAKCEAYTRAGKHVKSHIRRIRKHLEKYGPNDKQAAKALERYRSIR